MIYRSKFLLLYLNEQMTFLLHQKTSEVLHLYMCFQLQPSIAKEDYNLRDFVLVHGFSITILHLQRYKIEAKLSVVNH